MLSKSGKNTNVEIEGDQPTTIDYVKGKWTANPETGMVDADGNGSYIAKPGYTLEGAHEGALIGAVGKPGKDEGQVETPYGPFLVGNSGSIPAGQHGFLFLCINDDLDGRYGAGFADNEGEVIVKITERKNPAS